MTTMNMDPLIPACASYNKSQKPYVQSQYYHKEAIPEQNTGDNNPMYQLICGPHIMSPPALYTVQYLNTILSS